MRSNTRSGPPHVTALSPPGRRPAPLVCREFQFDFHEKAQPAEREHRAVRLRVRRATPSVFRRERVTHVEVDGTVLWSVRERRDTHTAGVKLIMISCERRVIFLRTPQGPQTENVYAATGTITPYLSPVVCVVGMWGWRDARLPLHSCRSCTGTLIGEEGSSHPLSALSLWGGGLNASSLLSLSLSLQSRVSSAPWFSRTAWRRCGTTHGATAPQPRPTARVRTRAPTRSPVTWGAGMWAMHVLSLCSVTARTAPLGYPCMHARAMHMHEERESRREQRARGLPSASLCCDAR